MYNRFIRNEHGEYMCIPVVSPPRPAPPEHAGFHSPEHFREPAPPPPPPSGPPPPPSGPPPPPSGPPPPPPSSVPPVLPPPVPPGGPTLTNPSRLLGQLLDRFHLSDVDTGDLLLLLILFLMFEEKADDELLIALGLLLIL